VLFFRILAEQGNVTRGNGNNPSVTLPFNQEPAGRIQIHGPSSDQGTLAVEPHSSANILADLPIHAQQFISPVLAEQFIV
jgi:hypothetical protein